MPFCRILFVVAVGCAVRTGTVRAQMVGAAGDFTAEIERLKNLAPGSGSGGYTAPTVTEQTDFAALASLLADGDTGAAVAAAGPLNYEVVAFTDTVSSLVFHGLREKTGGARTNGWGSYFVNLEAETADLVEVPHPLFDTRSWDVGARTFRDARGRGFLMAGAHRNANGAGTADVAHLTNTIFHVVHRSWTGPDGTYPCWQVHGFDLDNYPAWPAETDAVLSNGDGGVGAEIITLDSALEDEGFLSYAFNDLAADSEENVAVNEGLDGTTFSALGAKSNVQGQHTRAVGGTFVHVELEQSIRFNAAHRAAAAARLADTLRDASRVPPRLVSVTLSTPTSAVLRVESMVRTRRYDIEQRADLGSGSWSTSVTFSASAAGTNQQVTVSNTWPRTFFRARMRP